MHIDYITIRTEKLKPEYKKLHGFVTMTIRKKDALL